MPLPTTGFTTSGRLKFGETNFRQQPLTGCCPEPSPRVLVGQSPADIGGYCRAIFYLQFAFSKMVCLLQLRFVSAATQTSPHDWADLVPKTQATPPNDLEGEKIEIPGFVFYNSKFIHEGEGIDPSFRGGGFGLIPRGV